MNSAIPVSEGPSPTTASIAADEPERRPAWINYAAFAAALLFAIVVGLWLTRAPDAPTANAPKGQRVEAAPPLEAAPPPEAARNAAPKTVEAPAVTATSQPVSAPAAAEAAPVRERAMAPSAPIRERAPAPSAPALATSPSHVSAPASPDGAQPTTAPRKSNPPKPSREPIF